MRSIACAKSFLAMHLGDTAQLYFTSSTTGDCHVLPPEGGNDGGDITLLFQ
jgi:hypothetical protein